MYLLYNFPKIKIAFVSLKFESPHKRNAVTFRYTILFPSELEDFKYTIKSICKHVYFNFVTGIVLLFSDYKSCNMLIIFKSQEFIKEQSKLTKCQ